MQKRSCFSSGCHPFQLPGTYIEQDSLNVNPEAFPCKALIFHDVVSYSMIRIPCDSPLTESGTTLVCQRSKNQDQFQTGLTRFLRRGPKECKVGWIMIGQSCLLFRFKYQWTDNEDICTSGGKLLAQSSEVILNISSVTQLRRLLDQWTQNYPFFTFHNNMHFITHILPARESKYDSVKVEHHRYNKTDELDTSVLLICEAGAIYTEADPCFVGLFQCRDRTCVLDSHVCDQVRDCADGSDEDPSLCTSHCQGRCGCDPLYLACPVVGCVHPGKLCDGIDDCQGGWDETPCPTMLPKVVTCKDSTHIPIHWKNDLYPDCPWPDRSDEQSELRGRCREPDQASCIHGYSVCYDLHMTCLFDRDIYKGRSKIRFCATGGHLSTPACVNHQCPAAFKCPQSYCVPFHLVCDGQKDCPRGEDENSCSQANKISCPGLMKCRGENVCVHPHQILDGVRQCVVSGDDEKVISLECPSGCSCITGGLMCDNENITFVPQSHRSLKILKISHGTLVLNSSSFLNYENLVELDLSFNKLTSFPLAGLKPLAYLRLLNLSHNYIIALVDKVNLSMLINLEMIDLSHNVLMSSPLTAPCMLPLPSLVALDIAYNQISSFIASTECMIESLRYIYTQSKAVKLVNIHPGWQISEIHTTSETLCCSITSNIKCFPKPKSDEVCFGPLRGLAARIIVGILTVTGIVLNAFSGLWWMKNIVASKTYRMQVMLLNAFALFFDMMSVVYFVFDDKLRGISLSLDQQSPGFRYCMVISCLTFFSYEMSLSLLLCMTLDRFMLLVRGGGLRRQGLGKYGNYVILVSFLLNSVLSIIPVVYSTQISDITSNVVNNDFCLLFIGFGRKPEFWIYQMVVFVGYNFLLLVCVIVCSTLILRALGSHSSTMDLLTAASGALKLEHKCKLQMIAVKNMITIFSTLSSWTLIVSNEMFQLSGILAHIDFHSYLLVAWALILINTIAYPTLFTYSTVQFKEWYKAKHHWQLKL